MSVFKKDRWSAMWFERTLGPLALFVHTNDSKPTRWWWQVTSAKAGDIGKGVMPDEKAAKLAARRCAERELLRSAKERR